MPTLEDEEILKSATSLGQAIRQLREHRGTTLRDLASQVGISAPFLSDIEHNRRKTDQLAKIAEVLQVDFEKLAQFDGRISTDLKDWMAANPKLGAFLEKHRRSGGTAEQLLRNFRGSKDGRKR